MKGKRLDVLYTDVFTALRRQRQEGQKLKAILGYVVKLCQSIG